MVIYTLLSFFFIKQNSTFAHIYDLWILTSSLNMSCYFGHCCQQRRLKRNSGISMGTGRLFRFVALSSILINKWEALVRTERHRYDFFVDVVKGKRTDLFSIRQEHKHGRSEENNRMFCASDEAGDTVWVCNHEVAFLSQVLGIVIPACLKKMI